MNETSEPKVTPDNPKEQGELHFRELLSGLYRNRVVIIGCLGAIYAWWTINPRFGCSLGWLYVAMLGWELKLRNRKSNN